MGFCVYLVCMILLETVGLDSQSVIRYRWRKFILSAEATGATRGQYLPLSKA